MKRSRFICAAIVTALCAARMCTADVVSDFNDGTLQGWVPVGSIPNISNPGIGGTPRGFVLAYYMSPGVSCWLVAPDQFRGDWRNKKAVMANIIQYYGSRSWKPVTFSISGPGGCYIHSFPTWPARNWTNYCAPLEEPEWHRIYGSWDALLSNVTDFRILFEYSYGVEANGIDNVRLEDNQASNPGPADPGASSGIAAAKEQPDGASVQFSGVVSRVITNYGYVQSQDGNTGIRVNGTTDLSEGSLVTITGTIATRHAERMVDSAKVVSSQPGTMPQPIDLSIADIGGVGESAQDPQLGSSATIKETGILVRVTGRVSDVTADGTFRLSDGSGSVVGKVAPDVAVPINGSVATLVGISSADGDMPPYPVILAAHDEFTWNELPIGVGLIRNCGAEDSAAGTAGEEVRPIRGWNVSSGFTVTRYGYIYPPDEAIRIGGGSNFFFGGLDTEESKATQRIDLSCVGGLIDSGQLSATLSAYIGGRGSEGDYGTVTATFFDASGTTIGAVTLGPQASSNGHLIYWERKSAIPIGTRSVRIKMAGKRMNGHNNDQYYDQISFVLGRG